MTNTTLYERSPRLLCFSQEADGSLKEQGSIAVSGNVIDVTPIEKSSTIVIAVDDVHNAGSIQEWRSTHKPAGPIGIFPCQAGRSRISVGSGHRIAGGHYQLRGHVAGTHGC